MSKAKKVKKAKKTDGSNTEKHTGKLAHPLKINALVIDQGQHKIYAFSEKASALFGALSINRRIPDKDEGYQRVLSPGRVNALKRYIIERRPLPGAIIVNLEAKAKYDASSKKLTIPSGSDVGWVIDGQHRLASAAEAAKAGVDIELLVVAFIGLTDEKQIEQFITVNREAKNVPTSLYLDLLHHLPNKKPADIAKERCIDLATQLRKDEESPFYERIAIVTAPKPGQISLVNFTRKVSGLVTPKGLLAPYTEKEQLTIISHYYQGLRQVFSKEYDAKESLFFKTLGFGALWNVFPWFFSLTLTQHNAFTVKDVASVFAKIENTDFQAWPQYGTGEQAERNLADDLKAALLHAFAPQGGDAQTNIAIKLF